MVAPAPHCRPQVPLIGATARRRREACAGRPGATPLVASSESGCSGVQPKAGGKPHPRLNMPS